MSRSRHPSGPARSFLPAIRIRSYLGLLAALLVLFVVAPWLSVFTVLTIRVSDLLSLLVLVAGIHAVQRSLLSVVVIGLLAGGTVAFELLFHFGQGDLWAILANFLALAFLLSLFLVIEFDVFTADTVTTETLAGACCGYFLLAAIFASIYSILLQFDPGALSLWPGATIVPSQLTFQNEEYGVLGYFSIATLTTLGYGDIVPNSTATRSTAAVEALIGQLYIAVVIARMIGMYIAGRDPGTSERPA